MIGPSAGAVASLFALLRVGRDLRLRRRCFLAGALPSQRVLLFLARVYGGVLASSP